MGPKVKKSQRTHSFGGCGTCRRRHVKCDQVRPACLTCRAVGFTCDGYRKDLKWISASGTNEAPTSDADNTKSARRHLYTEQSRSSMSAVLQSDFAFKSVDQTLSEIDAKFKDASALPKRDVAVGPFRVLDFTASAPLPIPVPQPNTDAGVEAINFDPNSVESVDFLDTFDDFLNWSDLFELDFSPTDSVFQNAGHMMATMTSSLNYHPETAQHTLLDNIAPLQDVAGHNPSLQSFNPPEIVLDLQIHDAQMLLKNFRERVCFQMYSLPTNRKSPFQINNLNTAIKTFAEVTYLGTKNTSHAAFANLLALLAISATQLATQVPNTPETTESTPYWSLIATSTHSNAKKHLQWSFQTELEGPSKAKYKEQLMAVKAMLAYSILYDDQKEARCYMVDSERLLRLRGLVKRSMSRKCRILHHVYTWARIVGETTYVLRDYSKMDVASIIASQSRKPRKRQTEEYDHDAMSDSQMGRNARLDDFLRLERSTPENDTEAGGEKEHITGLRDIHLEDSREWTQGFYLELYGISESWLTLVSQTTRLANVMDGLNANSGKTNPDADFLESLENRKDRLENLICAYAATTNKPAQSYSNTTNAHSSARIQLTPRENMVRALSSALVIFFYRRIKNVNSWILQEHVNNVMQALKDLDTSLIVHNVEGPGSPWPAFLAGCEAMSQPQKDYFSLWMDRAFNKTGFTRFQTTKDVMLEVWKRRDQTQMQTRKHQNSRGKDWSWVQISKEKNIYLMLS